MLPKILLAFSAFSAFAASAPLHASQITLTYQVNVTSAYDYVTSSYVSIAPIVGLGTVKFDVDSRLIEDYGTTTITTFGGFYGTTFNSPVTRQIPQDPYGGAYGSLSASYTFPNVSDYPSTFIEEGASQANTYFNNGNNYANYHIELRATRRSLPKTGYGSSDYAFTTE